MTPALRTRRLAACLLAALASCGDGEEEARTASLEAEVAALREEVERSRAEIAELEAELATNESLRIEREIAFLEYNRELATLDIPVELLFRAQGIEPPGSDADPEPVPVDPEHAAALERAAEIHRSVRALMTAEEIAGLDLLEIGLPGEGAVGPVVFRLLDDRGRLAGSMSAERMRLEGSVAGRSLVIVLEEGFESHKGVRTPFRHGVRRIALPHVDPAPWIESMPELFDGTRVGGDADDGFWDLRAVRRDLGAVLDLDGAGEDGGRHWRCVHVSGVSGERLLGVHMAELDEGGRKIRHLFADRMTIERRGTGAELILEDGVSVVGDVKIAFVDGVFRIRLAFVPEDAWEAVLLPGLSPRPGGDPSEVGAAAAGRG
jgi:hypothetical protein